MTKYLATLITRVEIEADSRSDACDWAYDHYPEEWELFELEEIDG